VASAVAKQFCATDRRDAYSRSEKRAERKAQRELDALTGCWVCSDRVRSEASMVLLLSGAVSTTISDVTLGVTSAHPTGHERPIVMGTSCDKTLS
jgi:hypothetical protein